MRTGPLAQVPVPVYHTLVQRLISPVCPRPVPHGLQPSVQSFVSFEKGPLDFGGGASAADLAHHLASERGQLVGRHEVHPGGVPPEERLHDLGLDLVGQAVEVEDLRERMR